MHVAVVRLHTLNVCVCLECMSVHVRTPRGLVNHKSILVLKRINTENIITVISVSAGEYDRGRWALQAETLVEKNTRTLSNTLYSYIYM